MFSSAFPGARITGGEEMRKMKKNSWSDSSLSLGAKILITAVMLLMTASFLYPL